jgi:hypothetical protein
VYDIVQSLKADFRLQGWWGNNKEERFDMKEGESKLRDRALFTDG